MNWSSVRPLKDIEREYIISFKTAIPPSKCYPIDATVSKYYDQNKQKMEVQHITLSKRVLFV